MFFDKVPMMVKLFALLLWVKSQHNELCEVRRRGPRSRGSLGSAP